MKDQGVFHRLLCLRLDGPEQQNSASPDLYQTLGKPAVHLGGQMRVLIKTFLSFIGIFIKPFHEREVETGSLVHELGGMEMQVVEGGK